MSKSSKLCGKLFSEILASAKHQFIMKSKKYIYFIALPKGTQYSDECCVAFNETTGEVDIVNFNDITEIIVDGKHIEF
jgi:hypothetical protein